MKAVWLAVACFILAIGMRLGHIGENYALTYRSEAKSITYAIAFNALAFWLLLALAVLLGVMGTAQKLRIG